MTGKWLQATDDKQEYWSSSLLSKCTKMTSLMSILLVICQSSAPLLNLLLCLVPGVFIVCDWLRDVTGDNCHSVRDVTSVLISQSEARRWDGGQWEGRKQGLWMILRSCECLVSGCIMTGLQERVMFTNGKILQLRDRSWEKSWEPNCENTLQK